MKKFVFLVLFATAIFKDVHSYPVESAVDIVVPVKVEGDPVVPVKAETENIAPNNPEGDTLVSAIDPVVPAKAEAEPVAPSKAEAEPVAPVKSEAEPVAPVKSNTEPDAPVKSETEPVVPAKSETVANTPAKAATEPISPTKSVAEPVKSEVDSIAPTKLVEEPLVPAKSEIQSVEPTKSEVEPAVPDASNAEPIVPTKSVADPESPAKLVVEPSTKAEVVKEEPVVVAVDVPATPEVNFVVPDIPKSFESSEYGTSRYGNIWSNRLFQFHKAGGILRDSAERTAVPKTILVASEILMVNLVPQDAPNPLYSSEYSTLTDTFLLDFMSSEAIDLEDKKLLTEGGSIIKTRAGNDLVFKKDTKTNVLTVNEIVITKFNKLSGDPQITVVDIDGIPFDYRNKIDAAFQELSKKSSANLGVEENPPKVSAVESVESGVVDEVPKEVVEVESSPAQPLLTVEVKPKEEKPSVKGD